MNSDQLDFWPAEVARLPWEGRSPRSLTLTRFPRALFFKRERQEHERFFADPDQIDLFRSGVETLPGIRSLGAPSLLPLPRRA